MSRKEKNLLLLTIVLILLSGCGFRTGNPVPKNFLQDDKADIFLLNDIVYFNAQNIDWLKQLDYKIGEEVGVITKQTDKAKEFRNGTSNKLPVGSKIYETSRPDIFIAIVNGNELPYLMMVEG
jgi:hypothetical protein